MSVRPDRTSDLNQLSALEDRLDLLTSNASIRTSGTDPAIAVLFGICAELAALLRREYVRLQLSDEDPL